MKRTHNKLTTQYWLFKLLVFIGLSLGSLTLAAATPPVATQVTLTTHLGDEQHFQAGDEISLLVSLNRDAYLLLVYRDASGKLVKLFPVRRNDNGWIRAGEFMPFPRRTDWLSLIVAPPFGEEQVWAFAAAEAFPAEPLKNIDDIESLRTRLQDTGIPYSEAFTRLTTHADQR